MVRGAELCVQGLRAPLTWEPRARVAALVLTEHQSVNACLVAAGYPVGGTDLERVIPEDSPVGRHKRGSSACMWPRSRAPRTPLRPLEGCAHEAQVPCLLLGDPGWPAGWPAF